MQRTYKCVDRVLRSAIRANFFTECRSFTYSMLKQKIHKKLQIEIYLMIKYYAFGEVFRGTYLSITQKMVEI